MKFILYPDVTLAGNLDLKILEWLEWQTKI